VQIKVCICSAVPSGYWSGSDGPVQAVTAVYAVSLQFMPFSRGGRLGLHIVSVMRCRQSGRRPGTSI